MKKRWGFLLAFCALMIGAGISASAEGIVGSVYDSNTKAYIDCSQIEVYTYQNLPYIVAEDLEKYGFDVSWNPETDIVDINKNDWKEFYPDNVNTTIAKGRKLADVYDSQTKVRLDGDFVTAYSLSGRMLISLDELWRYGSVNWYPESNSISAMSNWAMEQMSQWERIVPAYLLGLDTSNCIEQVAWIHDQIADYYNGARTTDAWTYYNRTHVLNREYAQDLYAIRGYMQESIKNLEGKDSYFLQSELWDVLSSAITLTDNVIQIYDGINGHTDSYVNTYVMSTEYEAQNMASSIKDKINGVVSALMEQIH